MGWRIEIKLPDCAPEAKPNLVDLASFRCAQEKETFQQDGLKVRNRPPRNPRPRGADAEPINTLTSALCAPFLGLRKTGTTHADVSVRYVEAMLFADTGSHATSLRTPSSFTRKMHFIRTGRVLVALASTVNTYSPASKCGL